MPPVQLSIISTVATRLLWSSVVPTMRPTRLTNLVSSQLFHLFRTPLHTTFSSFSKPFTCPFCRECHSTQQVIFPLPLVCTSAKCMVTQDRPDRGAERELNAVECQCYICSWCGLYRAYLVRHFHCDDLPPAFTMHLFVGAFKGRARGVRVRRL